MSLRLVPPREGKTPNYYVRGTYLGVLVDATTGTADRAKARKVLLRTKEDIERGAFAPRTGLTWADGALSYVRSGGERTYLARLTKHFKTMPLVKIDQAAVDEAAELLYPKASAATRNRQVYTPVSAVLKHSKVNYALKRPKGSQGTARTVWLWPEQASAVFERAGEIDEEFRIMLVVFAYCGPRLSELLRTKVDDVRLQESFAYIGKTKNGDPRPVHLPPIVVAELANHPRGLDRPGQTLFRFQKNGHIYNRLKKVKEGIKIAMPERWSFHTLRHTFATWMRRYAGMDTRGLVATGMWRDPKSAARYEHVIVSEEAQRADLLPAPIRGKGVEK